MSINTSPARNPHHQHGHSHTNGSNSSSSSSHVRSTSRDVPVISATAAAAAADFDASIVPLGPKATTQRRYHRDFTRSSQHYASGAPSQPRTSSYLHHSGNQQRSRRGPDAPTDASPLSTGSSATGRKKKRNAHKKKDTAEKLATKGAKDQQSYSADNDDNNNNNTKTEPKFETVVSSSAPALKLGFDPEQIRVSLPKVGASFDDDEDDDGYDSSMKRRKQPSTMDGSVDSRSPSPSRSPVIRGISVTPPLMDEDDRKVPAGKATASTATFAPVADLKVSSIGTVIVDSSVVNKNRRRFPFEDPEYYAHQLSLYFYDLTNDPAFYETRSGAAAAAAAAANTAALQPPVAAATVPLVHPAAPAPSFIPAPPMSYYQAYEPYGVQAYGPAN